MAEYLLFLMIHEHAPSHCILGHPPRLLVGVAQFTSSAASTQVGARRLVIELLEFGVDRQDRV